MVSSFTYFKEMCNFYATFVIKQNYKNNCFEKYFNIEKIRRLPKMRILSSFNPCRSKPVLL